MIPQIEPDLTELEAQAAHEVILSGWVNEGNLTKTFAEEFAKTVGSKFAVPTTSCTAAMALSLMALNLKDREVIVPDITMIGTAMAVVQSGNIPSVVDVRAQDGCIDPQKVARAITRRTAAIIPVHLNGRNAVTPDLLQVANENQLEIVEDAACCIGSTFGSTIEGQCGTQIGTTGIAGCFSLAATKIVTTGQGGFVVTNDSELYERITRLKDWGRFEEKGSHHPQIGFNFKFTDIQASIGLKQLQRLPSLVARKREIYNRYKTQLGNLMFVEEDHLGFCPGYIDIKGQHFASSLRQQGIGSQPIWPALHQQGALGITNRASEFVCAAVLAEQILWLPSSTKLTDDQVDYVCEAVLRCAK